MHGAMRHILYKLISAKGAFAINNKNKYMYYNIYIVNGKTQCL